MKKPSVQSIGALVAWLHPQTGSARSCAALLSIVLLSACASSPWYDLPPGAPGMINPPAGAVITPDAVVLFAWERTPQTESYDFHIFNAETSDISQYMMTGLKPEEVCAGNTCTISLQLSLPDSARHAWRVRSSNIAGQSAWTRSLFTFSSTGEQQ